ncbi:MAG: MarR family winged helix-turn-helix transcriptional regulator [Candidatus Acidiferrales bacterium]
MSPLTAEKKKTVRAFRAYLDLLDTAEWMEGEMRGQLDTFDLTMGGFRVLEMLDREGPMLLLDAAKKCQCTRQNMAVIVERLEGLGWLRHEVAPLPAAEIKASRMPKAKRDEPRTGRSVSMLRLTAEGERHIRDVLPRHAKVVKALMRALNVREQEMLSRLLRKLREGDVLKFYSEMTHEDEGESG